MKGLGRLGFWGRIRGFTKPKIWLQTRLLYQLQHEKNQYVYLNTILNDPDFSFLRYYGYCAVRLPSTTIKLLQLYENNDSELIPIGEVRDLFSSNGNVPLPSIKKNSPTANLSAKEL